MASDLAYAEATALQLLETIKVACRELEEKLSWGDQMAVDLFTEKPKWMTSYRGKVEQINAAAAELTETIDADVGVMKTA